MRSRIARRARGQSANRKLANTPQNRALLTPPGCPFHPTKIDSVIIPRSPIRDKPGVLRRPAARLPASGRAPSRTAASETARPDLPPAAPPTRYHLYVR